MDWIIEFHHSSIAFSNGLISDIIKYLLNILYVKIEKMTEGEVHDWWGLYLIEYMLEEAQDFLAFFNNS